MLAPGSEIGRYVVRQKLAEGGMAEIYLASAVGPEGFAKDVVIKAVRSFLATDPQFVQMFIAEARLASRLNHANVVQIFDFGKHEDRYYLAMEYVRGASLWDLRKRCREQGVPFPPTLAAEVALQVARGLGYAHNLTDNGAPLGVVHRDVTPHNVLLSFDGAVKLTDFGIAKAQTSQTAPGMLKGKFAYMSPEQARGEKVDARTDLFALGIVLWELVTGGRLFDGDSDVAVLRAVQDSLIPPPSRLNPDVPQELSDIVMKALARPLAERFQTAFELERALGTFILRNATSVEDTSVASFLRQLYPEVASAPASPAPASPAATLTGDEDLHGDTHATPRSAEATMTATPVRPAAKPSTDVMPGLSPAHRGVRPTAGFEEPRPTEEEWVVEGSGPTRPKTEAMPAIAPSTRELGPRPVPSVAEPPVVLSQSLRTLRGLSVTPSPASVTEPDDAGSAAAPRAWRSRAPLLAGGLVLVVGLSLALAFVGEEPPPPAAVAVEAPPVRPEPTAPEAPLPSEPAPAAPPTEPAQTTAAAPQELPPKPDDVSGEKRPSPPAVTRKVGTLTVRATPYANVLVQGRRYEVTGVKSLTVTAGTFDVTLEHPRKKKTERVTVAPGASATVVFNVD
jgi:serine/threonine-protein kinase